MMIRAEKISIIFLHFKWTIQCLWCVCVCEHIFHFCQFKKIQEIIHMMDWQDFQCWWTSTMSMWRRRREKKFWIDREAKKSDPYCCMSRHWPLALISNHHHPKEGNLGLIAMMIKGGVHHHHHSPSSTFFFSIIISVKRQTINNLLCVCVLKSSYLSFNRKKYHHFFPLQASKQASKPPHFSFFMSNLLSYFAESI